MISLLLKREAPYVGYYVHGGKIATIVGLNSIIDKVESLTKDLAMQVASMGQLNCPIWILTQNLYLVKPKLE